MVVPDLQEATLQRQGPLELESLQGKERQGQKEDQKKEYEKIAKKGKTAKKNKSFSGTDNIKN